MIVHRFAATTGPSIAKIGIPIVHGAMRNRPSHHHWYLSLVSVQCQPYGTFPLASSINGHSQKATTTCIRRRSRSKNPPTVTQYWNGFGSSTYAALYYSTDASVESVTSHGDTVVPLFDPNNIPSSLTLLKQEDDDLSSEEINLKRALELYLEEIVHLPIPTDDGRECSTSDPHRPTQTVVEDLLHAYMELGYWEESLHLERYRCATFLELGSDEYADSLHAQGKLYLRLNDFHNSKRYYREALQYFESSNNTLQQGHVLISMAGWYYFRNQLDEALASLTQSETLLGSNPTLLVKCLDNQGLIYRLRGEFGTALDKYQQALQVVPDNETEWALRLHVGDMHLALEDKQEALAVYLQLLEDITAVSSSSSFSLSSSSSKRSNSLTGQIVGMQGVLMHNIATIHVAEGDYDMALEGFRQALQLKQSAPGGEYNPEVAKTLNSLGALYAGVFDEKLHALECFQQALLIARIHAEGDPQTDPDVLATLQNISMMEQELQHGEPRKS